MIDQIIFNWLDKTEQDLIANYDRLGLRASGDWAKDLEKFYRKEGDLLKIGILGNDYTVYLEEGRRPNKNQSPDKLKAWVGYAGSTFLKEWVENKGLDINPYAVAWKIAREGWEVPNKYNAGGLVTDVVNRESINELNRELMLRFINDFRSDIIKDLKIN